MTLTRGISLAIFCGLLAVTTSTLLWYDYGFPVLIQTTVILLVAALGEHYVSGKGYYHYTNLNGLFVGRVPVWIPLMWVAVIQGALLLAYVIGASANEAIALSGVFCASLDLYILEPLFSRKLGFWKWKAVDGGYFSFVPKQVNRFTAPFGNYLTWLVFPIILNWFLEHLVLLQMIS